MKQPTYLCIACIIFFATQSSAAEKAKIVFLSGKPSHGRMYHEHRAGNMILAEDLKRSGLGVEPGRSSSLRLSRRQEGVR